MTIRIHLRRPMPVMALFAAAMLIAAFGMPVRAATAVQIEARALVGGRYEVGGWAALSVTLINQGPPTNGSLTAETDSGRVGRQVDLPAGARKVVTLYVRPGAFQTQVDVTYTDPNGAVTATADVRVIEPTSGQVAVIGDSGGVLRQQLSASVDGSRPEVISIAAADLPERPEPLSGLGIVVWAGDATALSTAQRDSLAHWVAHGGRLVVIAGPDWQARTAGLEALLPVTTLASADEIELAPLDAFIASDAAGLEAATVATGPLTTDARAIVAGEDGSVLLSMRPEGAGQVVLVGADLAGDDLGRWDGAGRFWDRVVPATGMVDEFFGGPRITTEMDSAMRSALAVLPTLAVPPAELLLGVIVAYILLIGPISYLVLRRWDRRELAWVTAPLLIVTFTACSFGIGRTIKGTDIVVNQVAIVRATPSGAALVETFAGVFSPDRSSYDLAVDADALLTLLPDEFGDGTFRAAAGTTIEQGRPAQIRDLSIASFGFAGVRSSALAGAEPALEVTWSVRDDVAVGTVTNTSAETLTDVAVISLAGGERIGDLAPGASAEFTLDQTNINGSSASDQVYGFGGFANETEEQRRVALRREVINALVGYGGWAGMDAASFGNGPFIIGWREGEGPAPMEIVGRAAQRLTSVVEVLPIQPGIGTGQVTIQPSRMTVSVTETEGDVVGGFEAGSIIVNDGSVTFSIALPLEASGLRATSVRIAVGPDASIMLSGMGDIEGFWPQGYTVEVRDPTSGAWTMLGDLAIHSTYVISDPATALGPTGVIDVRVSGSSDPGLGQTGVFASAEVSGVLEP